MPVIDQEVSSHESDVSTEASQPPGAITADINPTMGRRLSSKAVEVLDDEIPDDTHDAQSTAVPDFDLIHSVEETHLPAARKVRSARIAPMPKLGEPATVVELADAFDNVSQVAKDYRTKLHTGKAASRYKVAPSQNSTTETASSVSTRVPGYLKLILMVCVEDERSVPELDWLQRMKKECEEVSPL